MEDPNKERVSIHCPDSNRWLAIAAGQGAPADGEIFYAHAATCDVCGPRLKDAMHLLTEDGSAAEDEFVARLESSQAVWQEHLATRLTAPEKTVNAGGFIANRPKSSWLAMHSRFVAICATAAAVVVFWFVPQRRDAPKVASPPMVAEPAAETQPQTAGKTGALVKEPQALLIAALTLEPGLTRGTDRSPVLKLPNQTKSIMVTLLFLDPPPKTMHIELMNSGQRTVWSADLKLTDTDVADRRVVVKIPARAISPDDYLLLASEPTEGGTEPVASYTYRVTR